MTRSRHLGLRMVSLLLCLVCFVGAVVPASAAPAEQPKTVRTTIVRKGAYSSSAVIGQVEDGMEIKVLDRRGNFYKVDLYDMTGFIATSQVLHTEEEKYFINCKTKSTETKTMRCTDRGEAMNLRHSLLALAKDQLGEPYSYGSIGPYGFDCSGLMYYLYDKHGIQLHRTASQQLQDGIVVSKEGLQVGDLIFFRESWEYYPASHVGIYAGNNKIIHAGSNGIVYANLDSDYFYKNYLCARRVIHTDTAFAAQELAKAEPLTRTTGISGRTAN